MSSLTTVPVAPERAEALREYRDANRLRSLDAAVEQLLNERDK